MRYRLGGRYDRSFLTGILLTVIPEIAEQLSGISVFVIAGSNALRQYPEVFKHYEIIGLRGAASW